MSNQTLDNARPNQITSRQSFLREKEVAKGDEGMWILRAHDGA